MLGMLLALQVGVLSANDAVGPVVPVPGGEDSARQVHEQPPASNQSTAPTMTEIACYAAWGAGTVLVLALGILAWTRLLRRRVAQATAPYHELFSTMVEGFAVHEIILDEHGIPCDYRFLSVNPAFERLTGLKASDVVGRRIKDIDPHLEAFWIETYGRVALTGTATSFEHFAATRGRHYAVVAYRPASGQFACIFSDISERKLAEQALRDSRERLALATSAAQIGIWDWDVVNNSMTWDAQMYRLYGFEPTTAATGVELWQKGLHPDDAATAWETCQAALRGDLPWDTEFRVRHPDGSIRHLQAHGEVIRDAVGSPLRMLGINYDVTARKLAEKAVQESELRYRQFFNASPDGVIVIGRNELITMANRMQCRMYGYGSPEELIGTSPVLLVAPAMRAAAQATMRRRLAGEDMPNVEYRLMRKDRSEFFGEVSTASLRNADGGVTGYICITRDTTERKASEDRLRQAMRQAEQANVAKSQFLATMSHEIRTPLNGVLGMADLLTQTALSDEQGEMVRIVQECGNGLLAVIGDVLDLAKIEAGNLEISHQDFAIRPLVAEFEGMFALTAASKGLRLLYEVDPAVPARMRGDPVRLRQVLLNLLGNALKFTERGTVGLTVRVVSASAERMLVAWEVSDTGPGIPDHFRARIFQPFTQADASMSRKHGGTGLGLAIAKRLSDLMGGALTVTTTLGQGSCFHFVVPLLTIPDATAPGAHPDVLVAQPSWKRPPSVLVVEDDATSQFTIGLMLEKLGCVHQLAENGKQAITAAAAGTFDLVLMDCQMPECDGYTATRTIRAQAVQGTPRLPIIALTANIFVEDRERCHAAGMDDFLAKPCNLETLQACLVRWAKDLHIGATA